MRSSLGMQNLFIFFFHSPLFSRSEKTPSKNSWTTLRALSAHCTCRWTCAYSLHDFHCGSSYQIPHHPCGRLWKLMHGFCSAARSHIRKSTLCAANMARFACVCGSGMWVCVRETLVVISLYLLCRSHRDAAPGFCCSMQILGTLEMMWCSCSWCHRHINHRNSHSTSLGSRYLYFNFSALKSIPNDTQF